MNFILLAHWVGRFGNRMHQYAYGATHSRITGQQFILPADWEGTRLFKTQHHTVSDNDSLRLHLNQSFEGADDPNRIDKIVQDHYPGIKKIIPHTDRTHFDVYDSPVYFNDLCAYNENIFKHMSKKHLLDVFEFSDEVKETEAYKYWSNRQGTYDLAHLRRDDISNPDYNNKYVQGYSVIAKNSYYKAFEQRGIDPESIVWVSDDYTGRWHQDRPQSIRLGWSYPVGSEYRPGIMFDWLEDFLKIYFARTVFRANSSFSWWACFLSPTATVYSPVMDRQLIYGRDNRLEEIDVQFFRGNDPHWMYNGQKLWQIVIN